MIAAAAIFKQLTGIVISATLTGEGILWAILLGLLVPVFSSIVPIRSALSQRLNEAIGTESVCDFCSFG